MENMEFIVPLEKWYLENKRDLPWRNTTDPYVIWISEVILQRKPELYKDLIILTAL